MPTLAWQEETNDFVTLSVAQDTEGHFEATVAFTLSFTDREIEDQPRYRARVFLVERESDLDMLHVDYRRPDGNDVFQTLSRSDFAEGDAARDELWELTGTDPAEHWILTVPADGGDERAAITKRIDWNELPHEHGSLPLCAWVSVQPWYPAVSEYSPEGIFAAPVAD